MATVEAVTVRLDLDPYFTLRGLSGYAAVSVRVLRTWLHHQTRPLPHYRLGEPGGRLAGKKGRGARVLVKRSEFDRWMAGWRQVPAPPPRDVGGILEAAVATVQGRRPAGKQRRVSGPSGRKGRRIRGAGTGGGGAGCAGVAPEAGGGP